MMQQKRVIAALGAATVATTMTACSGSTKVIEKTVVRTVTAAAATRTTSSPAPSSSSTSTTASAADRLLPLGTAKLTSRSPGAKVYALALDKNAPGAPDGGNKYVAAKVKVCARGQKIGIGNGPWSLVGTDSGTYNEIITGGGLKEPQYQDENTLVGTDCALGWITFEVPQSARIARIKYQLQDDDGNPTDLFEWRVR